MGRNQASFDILQSYLDIYSDIQTVALASVHLNFLKFPEENKLKNWYQIYKELLNKNQFFEFRFKLEKDFLELEKIFGENQKNYQKNIPFNPDLQSSISQKFI